MFLPGTEFYWDDPRRVGSKVTASDGSFYYRGPGYGSSTFIAHSRLKSRNLIKGDDAFFLFSLEGAETDTGSSTRLHAPSGQPQCFCGPQTFLRCWYLSLFLVLQSKSTTV